MKRFFCVKRELDHNILSCIYPSTELKNLVISIFNNISLHIITHSNHIFL